MSKRTRDRLFIEKIIKTWAQDHTNAFIIADQEPDDQGIINTGGFLTWLIQQGHANIDLLGLVDRIEWYLQNRRRKGIDGMYCKKCQQFYEFAEPNQDDGTLMCFSCRTNPYG